MRKKTQIPNLETHTFDEIIKGMLTVPKSDADNAVKRPNKKVVDMLEPKEANTSLKHIKKKN
jgi:hypothetical protein